MTNDCYYNITFILPRLGPLIFRNLNKILDIQVTNRMIIFKISVS